MTSDNYSWVQLRNICPINIDEIIKQAGEIEVMLNVTIDKDNIDKAKHTLIMASSEIEIMMAKFVSLLYDIDLIKTEIEQAIYDFLRDDLSRYLAIIDEKQNKLVDNYYDGEEKTGIGRITAFKKVLYTALYGIFYNTLQFASVEYINLPKKDGDEKEIKDFLRVLFLVMAINLSTLGGLTRTKGTSAGRGTQGQNQVGFTHRSIFPSRNQIFGEEGDEIIRQEFKHRHGEDLPKITNPFEEHENEESDIVGVEDD